MPETTQMTEEAAATTPEGATSSTVPEATATAAEATGEQQPEAQAKPAETKPEGAPEKYEFAAPEGQQYDDKVLEAFSDAAKGLNLTQEGAQQMLDKLAPTIHQRQVEKIEAVQREWLESSKADKEIGGDKLTENLAIAKKARDTFGTPELNKLLDETGLGNHPEIIRAFYKAGKAISEDGFVKGGNTNAPADPAKRLFPNQN